MIKRVGSVPVYVKDQNQALAFYRDVLGFEVVMAIPIAHDLHWIAVAPYQGRTELVLFHPAIAGTQADVLADRVGGFTGIVLLTDEIQSTYEQFQQRGVVFEAEPTRQAWGGTETGFSDPDGNRFHLVQRPDILNV